MGKRSAPNRKRNSCLTILPSSCFGALAAALLGAVMPHGLASTLFFSSLSMVALTTIRGGRRYAALARFPPASPA